MKRILYFVLLAAELFVGALFMISLWESGLYVLCGVIIAAMVGLAVWQTVRLVKSSSPEDRRLRMRNIALILLLPITAFIATYIVIAVGLVIAFV